MLSILVALAAQASSGELPPAQALPPPVGDEQPVLATVDALLTSFKSGDSVAMLRWVYPDGRVTATGRRANSSGVRSESWSQFTRRASGSGFEETISDPAIEIDGDAAMVWAPFLVRVGGKVANCGFDHFDLVRDGGVWKVMNLTFSWRTAGCPAQ